MLIEGEKAGLIHAAEREMIEDVLDLSDRPARAIMTPRPDIVWIDIDGEQDATIKTIRDCPYAQLLVCRGTLDDVVGVVRKQDLLNQALDIRPLDVTAHLHAPLIVPELTSILRTLDLFRKTPVNTAVVVDEYGAVQGVLTRTDLLEALAGHLPEVDSKPERKIIRRDDGTLVLDAATPISDVEDLLGLTEEPANDFVTVAGLLLSNLDHVPKPGEQLSHGSWSFEVMEMDGTRIKRVLAHRTGHEGEAVSTK